MLYNTKCIMYKNARSWHGQTYSTSRDQIQLINRLKFNEVLYNMHFSITMQYLLPNYHHTTNWPSVYCSKLQTNCLAVQDCKLMNNETCTARTVIFDVHNWSNTIYCNSFCQCQVMFTMLYSLRYCSAICYTGGARMADVVSTLPLTTS